MDVVEIVVLALIQGLTEFLPISSSAHLILPSQLFGWEDQGLAFDVAVHVGTLLAVVVYFRKDIINLSHGWLQGVAGRPSADSRLAWFIIGATIPAGLAGLFFNDFIELHLRSILVIAATTIIFGALLGVADIKGSRTKPLTSMSWKSAMVIGLSQALALIPGTSRSGITMTTALALGFDRQAAARFSFLLSIPIIALSGGYEALSLWESGTAHWGDLFMGFLLSAVSAWLCIHFFLKLIDKMGMWPFVAYRFVLGIVLLFFAFG